MKNGEFCHFSAESQLGTGTKQGWYRYQTGVVPVPNKGGTGTKQGWYRYHLCRGKMVPVPSEVVPVPLSRTGLVPVPNLVVPVPNLVVPVPLVPATPVLVFLH